MHDVLKYRWEGNAAIDQAPPSAQKTKDLERSPILR